jgi:transcriptional regulator with XRE-family HTH domain
VNQIQVGKQIRRIRQGKELSQENVAEELGITKGAFSKIENGTTNVPLARLLQVAKVLEVDITEFFKDSKAVSKAEDPKLQYGFATKSDIEEMMKVIQSMLNDINELKASLTKQGKPAAKKSKTKR